MKKSELNEIRNIINEGGDYDLKYKLRDDIRKALADISKNMEFFYRDDLAKDNPDVHKKAIKAYKKWTEKALKQLEKFKKRTAGQHNVYDEVMKAGTQTIPW